MIMIKFWCLQMAYRHLGTGHFRMGYLGTIFGHRVFRGFSEKKQIIFSDSGSAKPKWFLIKMSQNQTFVELNLNFLPICRVSSPNVLSPNVASLFLYDVHVAASPCRSPSRLLENAFSCCWANCKNLCTNWPISARWSSKAVAVSAFGVPLSPFCCCWWLYRWKNECSWINIFIKLIFKRLKNIFNKCHTFKLI
jgi:hypothetical protein